MIVYEDLDTDGYGSNTSTVLSCNAPAGYVSDSGDCDDTNIAINPSVDEQCDTVDNDCDGQVDEPSAIDASVWYLDHDGDTFGDVGFQTVSCAAPTGYVSDDTDCNDLDAMVNSLATEICDGVDNDCDGDIDDADANVDLNTGTMWYADVDQDGYGDAASTTVACALPTGYSADDLDCNDGDIDINPGATEVCDGEDNDCSGAADDEADVEAKVLSKHCEHGIRTPRRPVILYHRRSQGRGLESRVRACAEADIWLTYLLRSALTISYSFENSRRRAPCTSRKGTK